MKKKGTMLLALFCGLVCALSVFTYTGNVKSQADAQRSEALARYGGEQLQVCVATRDIAPGETVSSKNTTTKLWLTALLPEQAVETLGDVEGKRAASPILAGEVLSRKRFEGSSAGISVPYGLRAVSVQVKDAEAVGGALDSGMHVDVYTVGNSGAQLIATNVLVVAAGSTSKSSSWVTLAVEPEHVQELIAATQKTELYFALPGDEGEGEADDDE